METGFSVEGARSKRAVEQDQPAQEPMRVQKLRRNPDNGQKKARRQMQRKTAAEDRKGHSTTCPQCGAKDIHTRVWPDGSRLDAWCDNCHWKGTKTRKTKESTVDFNQREAEILTAMGRATLPEQQRLAVELGQVRAQRAAALEADREIDVSSAVIRDQLTPVAVHTMNTTATDWLDDMESGEITDSEGIVQAMRTEASLWFGRVGADVKADREEFAEQAQGYAHHAASAFGMGADIARRAFLDAVGHLHKAADSAVVVEPLPDSAPGPQNDQTAPWTTQETTGDSNTDASAQVEEHTSSLRAQAYASHQTHSLISQSALRALADDSPGQVDEDQSGNAESTITDYDTMGNDPEPFDEKMNGPLQPTGPFAVPSTRAPNVQGSIRPIAVIAAEIDINSVPPNAQPYLAAMDALTTVDDSFGPQDDGRTIVSYFLANAPGIAQEAELRTHVAMTLDEARAAKAQFLAELQSIAGDPQSGEAQSHDSEVEVGNPNDRPMWPWETPLIGDEGASGTDGTASNVADVPTPGGESGYPQPKRGSLNVWGGGTPFVQAVQEGGEQHTAIKVRELEGRSYEATCPNPGCEHHGVSFVHDDLMQDDDDEAVCPTCETPLAWHNHTGSQHTAATEWRVIQRGTGTRGNQIYENKEAAEAAASSLNEEHGTNDFLAKELGVVAAEHLQHIAGNPHGVGTSQWFDWNDRVRAGERPEGSGPHASDIPGGGIPLHGPLSEEQERWLHPHGSVQGRRLAALQSQARESRACELGNHSDCTSSSCTCSHHNRGGRDKSQMSGACAEGDHAACKMSHGTGPNDCQCRRSSAHTSSLQTTAVSPEYERKPRGPNNLRTKTHDTDALRAHIQSRHKNLGGPSGKGWQEMWYDHYEDHNPSGPAREQGHAAPNHTHTWEGTGRVSSLQKGAPFAGYKDFDACVAANQDKRNPEAYCGKIKHQVEGAASHKVHPSGVVEVFDHDAYRKEKTYYNEAHDKVMDHSRIATDGQCGRSWDDAVATSWTPAPSGRCPFEYEHHYTSSLIDQTKLAAFRARVAAGGGYDGNDLTTFKPGDRVETHPGTNAWIFGDRYGEVSNVGRKHVHVKMDRSGRTLKLHPTRIQHIGSRTAAVGDTLPTPCITVVHKADKGRWEVRAIHSPMASQTISHHPNEDSAATAAQALVKEHPEYQYVPHGGH